MVGEATTRGKSNRLGKVVVSETARRLAQVVWDAWGMDDPLDIETRK
jgi:hypothetical protein